MGPWGGLRLRKKDKAVVDLLVLFLLVSCINTTTRAETPIIAKSFFRPPAITRPLFEPELPCERAPSAAQSASVHCLTKSQRPGRPKMVSCPSTRRRSKQRAPRVSDCGDVIRQHSARSDATTPFSLIRTVARAAAQTKGRRAPRTPAAASSSPSSTFLVERRVAFSRSRSRTKTAIAHLPQRWLLTITTRRPRPTTRRRLRCLTSAATAVSRSTAWATCCARAARIRRWPRSRISRRTPAATVSFSHPFPRCLMVVVRAERRGAQMG